MGLLYRKELALQHGFNAANNKLIRVCGASKEVHNLEYKIELTPLGFFWYTKGLGQSAWIFKKKLFLVSSHLNVSFKHIAFLLNLKTKGFSHLITAFHELGIVYPYLLGLPIDITLMQQ